MSRLAISVPSAGQVQAMIGSVTAPATLELLDRDTLVPGQPYHLAWSSTQPRLAVQVLPCQGAGAAWSWLNFASVGPVGACLAARFATPAGVTGVAIEVDGLMQAVSVGATGPLGWEVRDGDGVLVTSGTWTVGATATDVTTGTLTLSAATEYEVRLPVNPGTPCSCMLRRIRVRPTVASDARWTGGFVRLDTLGMLWNNTQVPGYYPSQPAAPYPRQDGYAELRLRTTAAWIAVASFDSLEAYVGGSRSAAAVAVGGSSAGTGATTTQIAPSTQDATTYAFATLSPAPTSTAPVRVRVRGGEAALGASFAAGGQFFWQNALVAVYLPASAAVEIEEPARLTVSVGGDSKLTGAGTAGPSAASLPVFLRAYGFEPLQRGGGGDQLAWHGSSDLVRKVEARATRAADVVVLGWARNDLAGSTSTAQATVAGQISSLADEHHYRGPARVFFAGIGTEGDESGAFGSSAGTWDGFRALVQAMPAATGAAGVVRSSWCSYVDMGGTSTQAMMLGGAWSLDTVHPAAPLQAVQAELLRQSIVGGVTSGFSLLSLAPVLWCPCDSGITTAGAMGAVASTGTAPPVITLSGTAVRALTILLRAYSTGARGTWQIQYSIDGGTRWSAPVISAATVVLGGTGLTAAIATGNASNDNAWSASSKVAQVNDLSGNGRHLVQATPVNRPSFGQAAINNQRDLVYRPALVFPASNASFTVGLGVTVPSAAAWTIAWVGSLVDQTVKRAFVGGTAWAGAPLIYESASGQITIYDGSNQINANVTLTVLHHYAVTCDGAGAGKLYVDGLLAASGSLAMTLGAIVAGGSAVDPAYTIYASDGVFADFFVGPFLGADAVRCLAALSRRAWGTP